jgi:hypothetical protein
LSILQTTLERKTLIEITFFSTFVVKTPKRKKSCKAKMRCRLLVVLRPLIVASLLLIVVVGNLRRANAEGSQLSRSQRGVGVRDGQEDRDVGELLEWLIPLAVNNLLVAPHNLQVLLHDIEALIQAPTHHKDASEDLQKAIFSAGGRRGTATVGSARRSSSRTSTRSPQMLRHCRANRIMS